MTVNFDHQHAWVGKSLGQRGGISLGVSEWMFPEKVTWVGGGNSLSHRVKPWAEIKRLKREKQLNVSIVLLLPLDLRRCEQAASCLPQLPVLLSCPLCCDGMHLLNCESEHFLSHR